MTMLEIDILLASGAGGAELCPAGPGAGEWREK